MSDNADNRAEGRKSSVSADDPAGKGRPSAPAAVGGLAGRGESPASGATESCSCSSPAGNCTAPPVPAAAKDRPVPPAVPTVLPPQPVLCALRPQRPLLLWDGQCGFCQRWARRIQRIAGRRIDCQPYQQRLADLPEIAAAQFDSAVFLVLPDGSAWHSAQAVYRALALRWPLGCMLWLYMKVPAFARFSDRRYRAVAASRHCSRD